jgi:hypothetical protein
MEMVFSLRTKVIHFNVYGTHGLIWIDRQHELFPFSKDN